MLEVDERFNPIEHIRQVEKDSLVIIENAKAEAEKKLSKARAACDEKFKAYYNQAAEKLHEEFLQKNADALKAHKKQLEEYKESLLQKSRNSQEFDSFLTKSLF
ncbi:MAG: hypothetical protein K6E97_02925 [Treponema sp.]|nr:hypothetical protein [Treponema sp.]